MAQNRKNYLLFYAFLIVFLLFFFNASISHAATPTYQPMATASEVVVLYNSSYITDSDSDGVQDSLEIANYYKTARSIPSANVIGLSMPLTETVTRSVYNSQIKTPLESALTSAGLASSIKYIVTVRGVPLKVSGTINGTGHNTSVDASLCLLYNSSTTLDQTSYLPNPYYQADYQTNLSNVSKLFRFKTGFYTGIADQYTVTQTNVTLQYLVSRLDGITVANVKSLIDRGVAATYSASRTFVLDNKSNLTYSYMSTAKTNLESLGLTVSYDNTDSYITTSANPVIGYVSHGIHAGMTDGYYSSTLNFTYQNGAVADTYESFNAYCFQDITCTNHGLISEFIAAGGSGGIGNVYEPYVWGIANENVFLTEYAIGYSMVDAAYMSLYYLNWVETVVGDPLMVIGNNTTKPSAVTGATITANGSSLNISWTNPASFNRVMVVRGSGHYPTTTFDGTTIYNGTSTSVTDSLTSTGSTYYYTFFTSNYFENYASTTASIFAPSVGLSASSASGSEATTAVNFTAQLTSAVSYDVTVNYSITAGTATATVNYINTSGTATITAGNTSATIPVTVVNNSHPDGNTTFTLNLTSASVPIVGNSSETYTIQDDGDSNELTGLSNDATPATSKTWTWGGPVGATYRFVVDQSPTSQPTGSYGSTTTTTQASGSGNYYLHIQYKTTDGWTSPVYTYSAVLSITLLHSFQLGNTSDGDTPIYSNLILSGTKFYSMTKSGGSYITGSTGVGTIFSINTDGTSFKVLYSFDGATHGKNPYGSLVMSGNNVYGMTHRTLGVNYGVIFSMDVTSTSTYTVLHSFPSAVTANDGYSPYGSLILSGSTLYGMTYSGGSSNKGTIFSINTDGSSFKVLYSFDGTNHGSGPYGDLLMSGNTVYGMTSAGGASNVGVIFSMDVTSTSTYTVLHTFTGATNDGSTPYGSLALSGSTFYGMTKIGGSSNLGTVFSINTDGTSFRVLKSFTGATSDGKYPYGNLTTIGSNVYGMTYYGGVNNYGTVFSMDVTSTSTFSVLHSFSIDTSDGYYPYSSLTYSSSFLYGMTYAGVGPGTIFKMALPDVINAAGTPTITASSTSSALNLTINTNGNAVDVNYAIYNYTSSNFVKSDGTTNGSSRSWFASSTWNGSVKNLSPNTAYQFQVVARNGNNTEAATSTASTAVYTLANVPAAPTLGTPTTSTIPVTINENSNPSATTFSIKVNSKYVQADGTLGDSAVYRTKTQWGTPVTITGLSVDTQYTISVNAKNGDNTTTAYSSTAAKYTLANAPGTPTVTAFTSTGLAVVIDTDSNPTTTQYAIFNTVSDDYLTTTGVSTTTPTWFTNTAWVAKSAISLTANSSYQFEVVARNGDQTKTATSSASTALYTLANTPGTPTVATSTATVLNITIDTNSNSTNTQYAIYNSTSGLYLKADGTSNGSTPTWFTNASWTGSASGLSANTAYQFQVIGKNLDGTLTATSTASTAIYTLAPTPTTLTDVAGLHDITLTVNSLNNSTSGSSGYYFSRDNANSGWITTNSWQDTSLACGHSYTYTVKYRNGDGVETNPLSLTSSTIHCGHVGSYSTSSNNTKLITTNQLINNQSSIFDILEPTLDNLTNLLQTLNLSRNLLIESQSSDKVAINLKEFKLTATLDQKTAMVNFIAYGISPETVKLGLGERNAVLRDYLETVKTADVNWPDIQNITIGQKITKRNLKQEQAQVSKVLSTFQKAFNHKPNFANQSDDLSWNTLMYRIRFSRDLIKEKQGINQFKLKFNRIPKTPLDWATVRALGYVGR